VKHVVKRGRSTDVRRRRTSELSHFSDALVRKVTVLFLGEVQQGQHRRARTGVEAQHLFGPLANVNAKVTQRSTSPMTGSMVDITVIVSDIEPPRISSDTA
jgi:hypothetical protein